MDKSVQITNVPISQINPINCTEINALLHEGAYPLLPSMRPSLVEYNRILLKNRQEALKKVFSEDIVREDAELRIIGRAYTLTYP